MSSQGVLEYYANKSVLVTGGSGFIGKVLIEKILRCCPDIKAIYLLLRPKKGKDPQQRLKDLLNGKCFEKIKDLNVISKLHVIPGDIQKGNLGISEVDKVILQKEVNIIFHGAATVRFDMNLCEAIKTNVVGTKHLLDLAEGIKNLEVFVDISTSYCHDELVTLEEKVYPSVHKPQDVMDLLSWMNEDILDSIQPKLIAPFQNTYGFSKNLAEELVSQYKDKFAIAIARPSIVIAACKEPFPGWIDNINGPTAVIYTGAIGILHTVYCKEGVLADFIPVDVVANGCILLAYTTALERSKDVRVCNITRSGVNATTLKNSIRILTECAIKYPTIRSVWYAFGSPKQYRLQHKIAEFFFHIIPAYLIDFLLLLLGQRTFMIGIENRIRKGLNLLEYYLNKNWVFKNDYFRSLKNQISVKENEIFYTDLSKMGYMEYLKVFCLGVREFIAKEDISTLEKARRRYRRLYYLHVTTKSVFYILLAYIVYVIFCRFFV